MILKMTPYRQISDLQDKFSECFPGLRIEFFKGFRARRDNAPADSKLLVSELLKKNQSGEIRIPSTATANWVMQEFKSSFGLVIQLYKQIGGKWAAMNKADVLSNAVVSYKPGGHAPAADINDLEEVRLTY